MSFSFPAIEYLRFPSDLREVSEPLGGVPRVVYVRPRAGGFVVRLHNIFFFVWCCCNTISVHRCGGSSRGSSPGSVADLGGSGS